MKLPRILPLAGVAIGGVLSLHMLASVTDLPQALEGARAFAEEAAKPAGKSEKAAPKAKPAAKEGGAAGKVGPLAKVEPAGAADAEGAGEEAAATALPFLAPTAVKAPTVCAPTAAELAKEAGLSPAELRILQSLGERRGQLDKRETDLNTQLALMAAAEAKLDAKVKAMNQLKADIQGLLKQAKGEEDAEVARLVKVFEGMKPKDSAARMVILDDSVRLPIAGKMKERALSAMLAQMPPQDAKKLTESLAKRFASVQALAAAGVATSAAATTPAKPAEPKAQAKADAPPAKKAAPKRAAAKKAAPPKAKATQQAVNTAPPPKAPTAAVTPPPAPPAKPETTPAPAPAAPAAKAEPEAPKAG
jgi:flagellar motility protein MotE (MotC chaperone)